MLNQLTVTDFQCEKKGKIYVASINIWQIKAHLAAVFSIKSIN